VEEALFRVGTRFLELLTEKRQLVHMVFAEVRNNPGFGQTLGSVMMGILQRLTEFMEERIARGELRPHDTTLSPRVFMGGLFWYFFVHQNLTPNVALVTPERFTRFAVSALLQGLGSEDLRGADESLTALLASGNTPISSKVGTP
jgi:AcrR family transcriptional regulator